MDINVLMENANKNYFEILKVKLETLLRGEGGTRQNL
jgi:hypothetical protein